MISIMLVSMPLLAVTVSVVVVLVLMTAIHPFLALNAPVDGEILVVEGWLSKDELELAVEEYRRRGYRLIVTTGGPVKEGSSETYAEMAAKTIRKSGLDPDCVVSVPAPYARVDQSFAVAKAFREWLIDSNRPVTSLNVFTSGVHGRRSRMLYRKVLGRGIEVGVVSVKETRYNPIFWWLSSKGIRKIARNSVGYVYYALFIRNHEEAVIQ